MQRKRCAVCDATNPESALYCVSCGAFLVKGAVGGRQKAVRSIWENGSTAGGWEAGTAAEGQAAPPPDGWELVCPECGKRLKGRGARPLFCADCSHIFSAADHADAAVRAADSADVPANAGTSPEKQGVKSGGPLHRDARNLQDRSTLRLIGTDSSPGLILPAKENGFTFGASDAAAQLGRRFRGLEARHLFFWHTDSGWYVRALAGTTLQNGGRMDIGAPHPVRNGDTFEAGLCTFWAEVVPNHD